MHTFGFPSALSGGRGRVAFGLLALVLVAAIVYIVRNEGVSVWYAVIFAVAPDLALFAGMSPGIERGQLHPRAVPLYNALHNPAGPLLLGVAAALGLGMPWLVAALAWGAHIAVDRAAGYGPRTAEGFQRG